VALAFCRELHLPAESGTREPSDALSQGSSHAPGPRVEHEGVDVSGVRRSAEKMRSGSPKVTGVIALKNAARTGGCVLPFPRRATVQIVGEYSLVPTCCTTPRRGARGRLLPAKRTRGQHA
jgi:hypothetical protein